MGRPGRTKKARVQRMEEARRENRCALPDALQTLAELLEYGGKPAGATPFSEPVGRTRIVEEERRQKSLFFLPASAFFMVEHQQNQDIRRWRRLSQMA
jgi:hypothetical protein